MLFGVEGEDPSPWISQVKTFEHIEPGTRSYQRSLRSVAERLANVARLLRSDGFEEQARSIETTVADLDWQCEEFNSEDVNAAGRSR